MDANSSTSESWDHEFPQSVWLENTLLVVKYGLLPIVVTSAILGNSVILTVITRFRVKRASLAYMALVATTHILQSFITLGLEFGYLYYCPDLLKRRKELDTQMGLFVQSNLANRYIHRTGLFVVSLESPSSVEYITKKTFFSFVFSTVIEI